jgi:hypothetical protein
MSGLFAELRRRQRLLAYLGAAMAILAAVCLLAMLVDGRSINGVSVWTKPAKFAVSFSAWLWTLAWAWGVLAPLARQGVTARIVLWGTVIAGGYEQLWITWRALLGQPSHFATDPVGAVAYGLMGLFAVLLVAMAALLGLLVLLRGDPAQPRPWRLAVGLGLMIAGVMGGLTGASISAFQGPQIGGTPGDAAGLAPFFWSRDGGDLRVAHFLGVHAMQAVPALALLGAKLPGVALGALAWAGLTAAAYAAALAGIALSP